LKPWDYPVWPPQKKNGISQKMWTPWSHQDSVDDPWWSCRASVLIHGSMGMKKRLNAEGKQRDSMGIHGV
jgi:hypothetical protein